ncbi:PKD domain-containing protein [Cryomorphaceae bacterium 1068]|nr:PKD domain-containing protein [Cryomorphaceae bacterium 1068]
MIRNFMRFTIARAKIFSAISKCTFLFFAGLISPLLLSAQDIDDLINSSIFWLEANTISDDVGSNINQWNGLSNSEFFNQIFEIRFPSLEAGGLNDQNVVVFNRPGNFEHLINNQGLDILSGDRTFIMIYKTDALTHGLFTRGASFAASPGEGTFGIFPFNANYRVIWTENSVTRTLAGPNIEIGKYTYVKIELDREDAEARLYFNGTLMSSITISEEYSSTNFSSMQIGAYSSGFSFPGELQFFACLDRALSNGEQNALDLYLGNQYGNYPIDLGEDVLIAPSLPCENTFSVPDIYLSYEWSTGSESNSVTVFGTDTIFLTCRDTLGFLYSDTVRTFFDYSSIDNLNVVCSYDSLLWDLNLAPGFDVLWSDGSSEILNYLEPGESLSAQIFHPEGCSASTETITTLNDTYSETVELDENPNFCLGNDIFLSSGFEEAETYLWNTDEVTPFIQPQESGEYWVEATNVNGCVGRDTVEVDIVGIAPEVEFGFSPPCEENDVVFDDQTVPDGGMITEWDWTFENNDAGSSTDENPEIFYPATGEYPVELTVTLDNGCTGTTRDTLFVNPLPLVNFSAPIVCAGNEVFFESQSVVPGGGTISLREWSFGNGTTDAGSIGSTTFEVLGFNTVTHIVTTESACVDSLVRNVEVLGSPIVDFDVEDACLGETVVFDENVDTSVSGPVFYNWQFGDGFFSNFPNTSHEYAQPGVYEVTLRATGNNIGVNGCVDEVTKEIRIYEPPTAEITTADACIGATTDLVDVSEWNSIEGVVDPVTVRTWSITDGPTGTQEGVIGSDSAQVFVPEAAGTFDVSLELETAAGCAATANGSFLVQAIPTADFDLELPSIDPPFTSMPTNLSEDGINFEWLINGAFVSSEFEPDLTFDAAGDYTVELVATNDLNCNDTATALYTVIVPEYDLALIDLQYQSQGNKLVLNSIIGNNGNVTVETFDTEIQVGRDIDFTIESEFTIPPGEVVDYPLGSDIGYIPGRDLPYTCMRISNPNGAMETDTTNNYLCVGLNRQRATFAAPYPNPATDEVKLTFVMPEDGPLNVEITGADGRLIESFVLELKEGLNTVDYPLIGWSEGMYLFKFSFKNQEEVFRLVVAR